MSWEWRGQRRYYYRARRDGDRVIKEYMGPEGSVMAENAAEEDAKMRTTKAMLRRAEQERRQSFEVAQAQVTAMGRMVSDVVSDVLLAAGYYQHRRGPWRRRRK